MALTPSSSQKRRDEQKRNLSVLDRSLMGPVASVWLNSTFGGFSAHSHRQKRVSEDADNARSVKFTLSKTEDAMDSVIPCAAENFFRPMMQNKFGNPARLNFRYTTH